MKKSFLLATNVIARDLSLEKFNKRSIKSCYDEGTLEFSAQCRNVEEQSSLGPPHVASEHQQTVTTNHPRVGTRPPGHGIYNCIAIRTSPVAVKEQKRTFIH
jgi:hypothetical protein